jgi:flagellar protein FlaJ
MKPTKYSTFALGIFGRFFEKYMYEKLEEKNLQLVKADIQMSYEEFYSMTILNMILGYVITLIFTLFLYLAFPSEFTFAFLIFIPMLVTLCVGGSMLFYPKYRADVRGKNIDLFLPYAINFISSMAVAGISPAEIFQTLSSVSVYGEVQNEAKKITKEIDIMGTDNIRALKHAIEITPSRKFKGFLQGIIGTIQSGSDLHVFLANVAKRYMEEDLVERKQDLDLLAVIAEILVLCVIAFPILLVIILTVFGFFGGSMSSSITILLLFSFIMLPAIYGMFYLMIKSTSIERLTKIEIKYENLKKYVQDNKTFLLIVFVSSISVVIFYSLMHLFAAMEYFSMDIYALWDFAFISLLIMIGPAGIYSYLQLRTKKEMQQKLPDFLTEVGDSLSTGMNIFDAIKTAEKANYGKLSPEVNKMKNQLSWNVTIKNVLFDFSARMKSAIVQRIIIVIDKGIYMGGNTAKIFKAGSNEVEQVNQVEFQRRAIMSLYALVIIVCYGVFLVIILILDRTIFSEFLRIQELQAEVALGATSSAGSKLLLSKVDPTLLDYTLFTFVFVESVGSGLLAGFMMDGKLSSGVRFSIILGIIAIVIFKILL